MKKQTMTTTQVPTPFTQANIINAFADLTKDNKDAQAAFNNLRHNMVYVAPEKKQYTFWNGGGLQHWPGLCGILSLYAGDNIEMESLFNKVVKHYNSRKQKYGENKGFEKGKTMTNFPGIELYNNGESTKTSD